MTRTMQPLKTKTLIVSALLLTAGTAGILLAGSALAADWHDYTGTLLAGNAYRVTVPEGADTLEILLTDAGANASAQVTLFDPSDKKVGHHALGSEWTSLSITDPMAGDYVLFVYEVKDAALKVRVLSDEATDLSLQTLELARNDKLLGNFKTGAALKQQFTVQVPVEPAFATLFYKGSVGGLAATLASPVGPVLAIADETGTAMSPGVWTSEVTGERTVTPKNLAAGAYLAQVDAESFEGSLYLTTLTYTREVPETPKTPGLPDAPIVSGKIATLQAGKAYGVNVPEDAAGFAFLVSNASNGRAWCCSYSGTLVTLVSPEDEIVGLVQMEHYQRGATTYEFNGTGAGEYILYVQGAKGTEIMMSLLGGADLVAGVREVALVENVTLLGHKMSPLPTGGKAAFTVERPLLGVAFGLQRNLASSGVSAEFINSDGETVAHHHNFLAVAGPSSTNNWWDGNHVEYEMLQAGTYEVQWHALQMSAEPYYKWLSYDRLAPVKAPAASEA